MTSGDGNGRIAARTELASEPRSGGAACDGPSGVTDRSAARGALKARSDPREVVTDPQARYYGVNPSERTLLPGADALVAETRFQDWHEQQLATA